MNLSVFTEVKSPSGPISNLSDLAARDGIAFVFFSFPLSFFSFLFFFFIVSRVN